ncbi:MAG: hypothetical protein LBL84_00325, partial [Candidatus Nomurabacteria bacterium]|nr:hypothetical protein [Candidatus Nomurabacteria bacterium]
AFCLMGLGVLIALAIVIVALINNNSISNAYNDKKANYEQLLEKEKTAFNEQKQTDQDNTSKALAEAKTLINQIDTEKRAVYSDYSSTSGFLNATQAQRTELERIDEKYASQVSEINNRLPSACKITGTAYSVYKLSDSCPSDNQIGSSDKEFNAATNGSNELKELETEVRMSDDDDFFLTPKLFMALFPLLIFGGLGVMLLLFAHQREIAAYSAQAGLPVATEAIGKGVKALGDDGTIDTVAKQVGNVAESVAKGIKKGLKED